MKKLTAIALVLALGSMIGFSGTASAQKMHGPKPAWGAMLAGLTDIQTMTGALFVFDMKRVAATAEELAKRERFISNVQRLPEAVRNGHAKVADAATEVAAAANTGEETAVSAGIAKVMDACNACHYDIRDKKRREKM